MLDLCTDGWQQGSLLDQHLAVRLLEYAPTRIELGNQDVVVVLSHDCDICQPDLDKEPWVELLPCHAVERRPRGDLTLMKNPRRLEFQAADGRSTRVYYALAAERWSAPRDQLAGVGPAGFLTTSPADLLPSWIGRRYTRVGFPNSFDRRWKPALRAVDRALEADGEYLAAMFVTIVDEELPDGTDYELIIRGAMLRGDFGVAERQQAAQRCLGSIAAALDACDGITVAEDELVSEVDISLDDIRVMKRWDPLDIASFGDEIEAAGRVRRPGG